MDVDRAVEGFELLALQHVHQCVAREDAAGALGQRQQNRELVRGDGALLAVDPHDARALVDLEAAEAKNVGFRCGAALAAQDGAQAGLQFARLEWLGEIVVGAQFEADHAVHRLAARRQHQDRDVAAAAQPAAEIEAVGVGQHEVEDDRVESLALQLGFAVAAGAGDGHTKARPAEIVRNHPGEAVVVVDHQDALGHRLSIGPARSRCHLPSVLARFSPSADRACDRSRS